MDQEELQFLGFTGIFKESIKIIFSWKKIFTKITLAFIFPLSFIFLAHFQISQLLFFNILTHQTTLNNSTALSSPDSAKLSRVISSDWTAFWLFKLAYFTFFFVLSLLSTSAVVYTVACAYTSKTITFRNIITVVPKVWKRLMVTFIWNFVIILAYNIVAATLFFIWVFLIGVSISGIMIGVALLIIYLVGFVYITIVWHLACVVSVLENVYGIRAMVKSNDLIKGKMGVAGSIFVLLVVWILGIEFLFEKFVVLGLELNLGIRVGIGVLCSLLLLKVILLGLVAQTVIYLVCKSYHHENIDRSLLADHLEDYLEHYLPLKAKDVQLEEL